MSDKIFLVVILFIGLLIAVYISFSSNKQILTSNTSKLENNTRLFVINTIAQYDNAQNKTTFFDKLNLNYDNNNDNYIFIIKHSTANIVVQPVNNDLINTDVTLRVDSNGNEYGRDIINKASEKGAWIRYKHIPPGGIETVEKISYIQLHDGYIFGSGFYTNK